MAADFPRNYKTPIPLNTIRARPTPLPLNANTGTFQNWTPNRGTEFQVCDGEILDFTSTAIPIVTGGHSPVHFFFG